MKDLLNGGAFNDSGFNRIFLRLHPFLRDVIDGTVETKSINLARRRQTTNRDRHVVLAFGNIDDMGEEKCFSLRLRQAAELPTDQRHKLSVFIDRPIYLD